MGLLLSERMINCPMQAVPKLHEALLEDIAWAVENEVRNAVFFVAWCEFQTGVVKNFARAVLSCIFSSSL